MGLAFDAVLCEATLAAAGTAAASTTASGDSLAVRNFAPTDSAYLEQIILAGPDATSIGVKSPLFHDNVEGILLTPGESPSVYSMPAQAEQPLRPQDQLTVTLGASAASAAIGVLLNYYTNLPGAAARLHSWADIMPLVKNIKAIKVACTSSATIGAWSDTVSTTTEDLTHANTDYAVLGFSSNVDLGAMAIKGIDTGNLRCACPGTTSEFPTTEFFVRLSDKTGRPHIPVFNSANKNNTFVSVCAGAASVVATVELICVELSSNLSS